jgi:hypothetical protein
MPTSGALIWDNKEQRYVRRRGPRKPFKGIVGAPPRKRSYAEDMWPIKMMPNKNKGLTGAEKRRKRKGGRPDGGPGGGGVQGSMKRLKAALDSGDESKRGHVLGKGFA